MKGSALAILIPLIAFACDVWRARKAFPHLRLRDAIYEMRKHEAVEERHEHEDALVRKIAKEARSNRARHREASSAL